MKKSFKKDIRALLENLCNLTEEYCIEYKIIWEYRYSPNFHNVYMHRLITVFQNKTPIHNEYFKNDLEIIQYLIDQISKYK